MKKINFSKQFLTLLALLATSVNAWGATLYGKVAVGAGKGTATVEIYNGYNTKKDSKSTTGAQVSVSYGMSIVSWGYCKFLATADAGYTFAGWYTNAGCTTGENTSNPYTTETSQNSARTDQYWAKFTPNKYTITFDNQSATTAGTPSIEQTFDDVVPSMINVPTKTGYTFVGYYTGNNGSGVQLVDANGNILANVNDGNNTYTDANNVWKYAGNITLYARWAHTVTFDATGGSVTPASKQVAYNTNFGTLPAPTRRFYAFAGWFTAAEGGTQITANTKETATSSHSIYAHWTLAPEHQTISWMMPLVMSRNSKQAISLVSTSGLAEFDVTSSNPEIIAVNNGYLQAGNTNGEVLITAIQPGNEFYYPDTLKTVFTVSSKDVPYFYENGFSAEGINELKVDNIVTLSVANVSAGLDGNFTVTAAKNGNVIGVAREGNSIVFTALHVGQDTITVTQVENSDYEGATRTYIFHVTRSVPEFTLSKDALELGDTAMLTLKNIDGASIVFDPEGKVSYDGSTGIITAVEPGTTTLMVSQAETNALEAKAAEFTITVSKKTPSLTVMLNQMIRNSLTVAKGSVVDVAFDYESDAELVVAPVSGSQYASYIDGKMTAGAIGTATYRATLAETDTYLGIWVEFTLTVEADNRHLEVNITSEGAFNNLKSGSSGDYSWKGDEGFCVGGYNGWLEGAANWDDKYVEFKFDGVPDKLSFDYKFIYRDNGLNQMTATIPGGSTVEGQLYFLYVDESADKQTWSAVWNDQVLNKSNYQSASVQLKKTTRYVRFHLHANYGALYKNIKITELKYVEEPEPANINFGSAVINSGEVSETSLINWCNIAPLSVTSSNPRFTVTPAQFGNFDTYSTQQLTISYTHTNEVGVNEGDITIANATYSKTIHVRAETTKRPQTITWNADLTNTGFAMNVDEQYPDDIYVPVIATATSGQRITYTSSNEDVVEVIADTALLAKAVGSAEITAHQAGDAEYDEVSDTKAFQVTNKQKQSILWEQNLYGLLTTSGTVELTATATSGGEITYTSGNPSVVTVSGNILTVVGEGETYITATQAGFTDENEVEWLGVTRDNYVIVRNPASQCNGLALSQGSLTLKNNNQVYDLSGIPSILTFTAKHGTKSGLWGTAPSYAPLKVEQYANIDNQWDWYEVYYKVVGTDNTSSGNIALDESAKKVRFSTIESGTDHTISDIRVTRKKFMRADVAAVDLEVESNAKWQKTITVSHSDIDLMTVTSKQGLLNLSTSTLGEGCGDFGDDAFIASFTPTIKNHEYKDTIVITDGKAQPSTIVIPVRLYSKGLNQSISGFELPETAVATDVIPVSATASSELEVSFLSSNSEVAYVENGYLQILKADTVTITAIQPGNDTYDAAPSVAQFITITKAASAINVAPMAADINYGQTLAEATLTGGEGSVPGTFAWETPAAVPAAGTQTYTVVFTPAQSGIYATASTLVSVKVAKATPTVTTWPTASDITIAQSVGQSELTGGEASVEGTFVWKNPTESRLPHGTYERAVIFTPTNQSYNTVEGTVSLNVINVLAKITEKPTPVVENPTYGMTLADVTLQGGSANVEGAFSWADTTTPLLAGTHDYEALFTPQDLELYAVVHVGISITSAQAIPSIVSLPTASDLTYGTPLSESVLTGGEGSVAGAFQWKEGDKILNRGTQKEAVLFVPENANYATLEDSVSVSILMGIPQITSLSATGLTYGQTLEASQLSGEANIEGTFAWAADLATVLTAGAHEVAVHFTSADENYNDVDTFAVVTVAKATPQITMLPIATELESGETLAQSTLSGGVANTEGTFAWADSLVQPEVGTQAFDVIFTPVDTANYTTTTIQVSVTTLTVRVTLVVDQEAPIKMIVGQSLSEISLGDIFFNAYVGETEIDGTIDWEDPTMKPAYGAYNIPIVFTPDNEAAYSQAHATVVVHVLNASDEEDPFTALDNANVNTKAQKILRNGQILIIRDGRTYNLQGLLVE